MTNPNETKIKGNYLFLDTPPSIPSQSMPNREQCFGYEYMTMVQFCNITEVNGLMRSRACNAFGGDRGKHQVVSDRMARIAENCKYVLIRAVDQYFKEMGIAW